MTANSSSQDPWHIPMLKRAFLPVALSVLIALGRAHAGRPGGQRPDQRDHPVDNTGEADATPVDLSEDRAMILFTGEKYERYWLSSVALDMEITDPSASATTYTVKLYNMVNNAPGNALATLTNPASLRTGLNRFTLPDGYRLDGDTGYAIVVSVSADGADGPRLRMTASADQDGEEGWEIGNAYYHKDRTATNWSIVASQTPRFLLKGYPDPTSPFTLVSNTAGGELRDGRYHRT